MIVVALLAIVVGFLCFALVGWALWLLLTTLVTGLVIGAVARLIVPGKQHIGVFATIVCGLLGSLIGTIIGKASGIGNLPTVGVEIGAAMIAVVVAERTRRTPVSAGRRHRVIDI
jgi:uncharacterized membrane protein YeaQ/YmgE (transglycosylase-associated protein family)